MRCPGWTRELKERRAMKKAAVLVLEESVALELRRILDDDDGPAALVFVREHLQVKVREMLEGG
jgi:hypothetical protein